MQQLFSYLELGLPVFVVIVMHAVWIGELMTFYCYCFRSKMEREKTQVTREEYIHVDNQYIICFEPHISQALEGSFTESLLERGEPSAVITNSIWPFVDSLQS